MRFRAKNRQQCCRDGVSRNRRSVSCRNGDRISICIANTTVVHHNRFDLSRTLHRSECRRNKQGRGGTRSTRARTRTVGRIIIPECLHPRIHRRHRRCRWYRISGARRGQRDGINATVIDNPSLNHRLDRRSRIRCKSIRCDGCCDGRVRRKLGITRNGENNHIFTSRGESQMRALSQRRSKGGPNTRHDGACRRCRYCAYLCVCIVLFNNLTSLQQQDGLIGDGF